MQGFFSNLSVIFKIAESACQESIEKPDCSYISIIFSCIGLEAFINLIVENIISSSIIKDAPKELITLQKILSEFESSKASIITKYTIIPLVLSGKPWEKEHRPFKDFNSLIKIRNALVHSKPDQFDLINNSNKRWYPKFLEHLIKIKVISKPPRIPRGSWEGLIRNYDVAQWSYETACWMIYKVITFIPNCKAKILFAKLAPNVEVKIKYEDDNDKKNNCSNKNTLL